MNLKICRSAARRYVFLVLDYVTMNKVTSRSRRFVGFIWTPLAPSTAV